MDFSKILKQERKKQNLTQFELAELLNVSDKTISSWENGRSYPDVIMLKSIANVLKIDVTLLLNAEDFNPDVKDIDKESLKENHLKEKKYIRCVIVSICLNVVLLVIPIIHIILSNIYGLKFDSATSKIPNFTDYEKISKVLFPILIASGTIIIIGSITVFIISTIKFKNNLVDTDYNVRYKLIMYQCINIYAGVFVIVLFLTLTPLYIKLYFVLIAFISLLALYIFINVIVKKILNLVQIYNSTTIIIIFVIVILCISSIVIFYIKIPFVMLLLLTSIYISLIVFLHYIEIKKYTI